MGFQHTFTALVCLGLVGAIHAHESIPGEDYWQAIWPNTQILSTLKDLLKPGVQDAEINDLPMKTIDDTQYPKSFFFQHDLYPGKIMNLEFNKHPYAQPFGVWVWVSKVKDSRNEGFTYEDVCIKNPPSKGKHWNCAKSLGTMIGFSISMLGKNIQALSSSFVHKQNQYTVEGVQSLGHKAVVCHRLNFRNVVYYCHANHETTAYMVTVVAADGTRTRALALCHHDTSDMDADILYEILKFKPGNGTACHYLGNKAVLWVPNLAVDNAYKANMASY